MYRGLSSCSPLPLFPLSRVFMYRTVGIMLSGWGKSLLWQVLKQLVTASKQVPVRVVTSPRRCSISALHWCCFWTVLRLFGSPNGARLQRDHANALQGSVGIILSLKLSWKQVCTEITECCNLLFLTQLRWKRSLGMILNSWVHLELFRASYNVVMLANFVQNP